MTTLDSLRHDLRELQPVLPLVAAEVKIEELCLENLDLILDALDELAISRKNGVAPAAMFPDTPVCRFTIMAATAEAQDENPFHPESPEGRQWDRAEGEIAKSLKDDAAMRDPAVSTLRSCH